MKPFKVLFIAMLFAGLFAACEPSLLEPHEDLILEKGESANEKVALCHLKGNGDYVTIKVSVNALDSHLAHGDKLSYSPEGVYNIKRDKTDPNYCGEYPWWTITIIMDENGDYVGSGFGENYRCEPVTVVVSATVNDGVLDLEMIQTIVRPEGNVIIYHYITGTVAECGGIISFDNDGEWNNNGDYFLM